jgi:hypothetical protein
VNPNVVVQLGWAAIKVAKPIQLTQGATTPTRKLVLGAILECGNMKFTEKFTVYTFDVLEAF